MTIRKQANTVVIILLQVNSIQLWSHWWWI